MFTVEEADALDEKRKKKLINKMNRAYLRKLNEKVLDRKMRKCIAAGDRSFTIKLIKDSYYYLNDELFIKKPFEKYINAGWSFTVHICKTYENISYIRIDFYDLESKPGKLDVRQGE